MNPKPLLCLLLLAIALPAIAQTPDKDARDSDRVMTKWHQLMVLNQILPLLLTQDQIKAILIPVEESRAAARKYQALEAEELRKLEVKFDAALKVGFAEGKPSTGELYAEATKTFNTFVKMRQLVTAANTDAVLTVMKAKLNVGQLKAAANALQVERIRPDLNADELTQDQKLRIFVEEVLLHDAAYDVLVKLSRIR